MNLSIGIVGLPNVGKSTLFNALTKQQVLAANYPFATIDPNRGIVPVHDERIFKIAEIEKPEKLTPATVEFVDIAGLVKGAAEGQGLGNKFLANIRETSAILHLVRAFKDPNITHVENSIDLKRDIELINYELVLKDIDTVETKLKAYGKAKPGTLEKEIADYFGRFLESLGAGIPARSFEQSSNVDVQMARRDLFLLSDKPMLYLVNSTQDQFDEATKLVKDIVGDAEVICMDVKLEEELSQMDDLDRKEFMDSLGLEKTGLELLSLKAYNTLGLISYFTSGPKETRAWTIKSGTRAQDAAGEIHTDIKNHFIVAEVTSWSDFVEQKGWVGVKPAGKLRLEGKDYLVKDGDVMLFKHNG